MKSGAAAQTPKIRAGQRDTSPHSCFAIEAKSSVETTAAPNTSGALPDDGRGQVVEEAVGGKRVLPRIPEVVPEQISALDEQRAVEVHRGVAWCRAERE